MESTLGKDHDGIQSEVAAFKVLLNQPERGFRTPFVTSKSCHEVLRLLPSELEFI